MPLTLATDQARLPWYHFSLPSELPPTQQAEDREGDETTLTKTLTEMVLQAAQASPANVALRIAGEELSYKQLLGRASSTSRALPPLVKDAPALVLIWASHSSDVYVGILAALLAGRGYVPLNPTFPEQRLADISQRSGAAVLLVAPTDFDEVQRRMGALLSNITVVEVLREETDPPTLKANENDIAYLLFTSGSTGKPKGVAIRHRNAVPLIRHMVDFYAITWRDVCSQNFELTFDLSVHSIFTAWVAGAILVVPNRAQRLSPSRYIQDEQLTIWYSVPSVSDFMRRLGQLKPGVYPGLRAVLFCGEALSVQAARRWMGAAPNAVVDNHYGPTEASMSVTGLRLRAPQFSAEEGDAGIVPIGYPYRGVDVFVVDPNLCRVPPGGTGELLLGGAQVADGYWRDQERTDDAFVRVPWYANKLYRTGDRVLLPVDSGDPMEYVGRLDNQIKLFGHRVELGEIESLVQAIVGFDGVAAVPWPPTEEGFGGIELFLGSADVDADDLRQQLPTLLPPYMLPKHVHVMSQLPLNSNGKIDRAALTAILEERRDSKRG